MVPTLRSTQAVQALMQRHADALIRERRPLPLVGLLRRDVGRGPAPAPDHDDAAPAQDGADPEFTLSTQGEATDHNIVRAFWDVSRAETCGIPVLWAHNQRGEVLGQWADLRVEAEQLIGRAVLDREDPEAERYRGKIRRRVIRAVSVGWVPGETIRRGDLPKDDPLYREPVDGFCGPEEGMVMGSAEHPNVLVECSLVGTPAQADAHLTGRLAERALGQIERLGGPQAGSVDALLAVLRDDQRIRAWLREVLATDPDIRALLGGVATSNVTDRAAVALFT